MKDSSTTPYKSFRLTELGTTEGAMPKTRILKTIAALTVLTCVVVSTIGTVVGMMRSFEAMSREQTVAATKMSDSIGSLLNINLILMPIAVIASVVWFACWRRLRPKFRIEQSIPGADAN